MAEPMRAPPWETRSGTRVELWAFIKTPATLPRPSSPPAPGPGPGTVFRAAYFRRFFWRQLPQWTLEAPRTALDLLVSGFGQIYLTVTYI
jgi:hypothetical protein